MAHALYHAKSSAKQFGGVWQDYLEVHEFLDQTKSYMPDNRHRVVFHNSFGIEIAKQVFGHILLRASDEHEVPISAILEKHILEDGFSHIPTLEECLRDVPHNIGLYRKAIPLSTME